MPPRPPPRGISIVALGLALSLGPGCYLSHERREPDAGIGGREDASARDGATAIDAALIDDGGLGNPPVWTELRPSGERPRGRFGHFGVHDPARDAMWIVGGRACLSAACVADVAREVWRFDLATETWAHVSDLPVAITGCDTTRGASLPSTALFDAARDRIVIPLGCAPGGSQLAGTLDLASGEWTSFEAPGDSSPRVRYSLDASGVRGVGISRDGAHTFDLATLVTSAIPIPGLVSTEQVLPAGETLYTLSAIDPRYTWVGELDIEARSFTERHGSLSSIFFAQSVWDPSHERILAFGGWLTHATRPRLESGTVVVDPTIVDGADVWLVPSPRGRERGTFIWDAVRGRAILFGGLATLGVRAFDDIWSLELADE